MSGIRHGLAAIGWLLLLPLLTSAQSPGPCPAVAAKPFQRAMIFSASGYDYLMYIGMYDAAVDAGKAPDLLVATSGGCIAAEIIATFPDRAARNEFLASDRFHHAMLSIQMEHPRVAAQGPRIVPTRLRIRHISLLTPHNFVGVLASVPRDFGIPGTDRTFGSLPGHPKLLLVASALNYGPGVHIGVGRKLVTETWFTDPETAAHLVGLNSAVAAKYSRGAVDSKPRVIDNLTLSEAVYAAISEPYAFEPACVAGTRYAGGVANLWPLELADTLAAETVIAKQMPLSWLSESLGSSIVELRLNARRYAVEQMPVAYRVDLSDFYERYKKDSFWFASKWVHNESEVQAVAAGESKKDRAYRIPRFRIVEGVPEDHGDFYRRVKLQWQFGYDRAMAAFGCGPPR